MNFRNSLRSKYAACQYDEKSFEENNFQDKFNKQVSSYHIFRGYFSENNNVPMVENSMKQNKESNNLEVLTSQKSLQSTTSIEKLEFQNSGFLLENKLVESNYILEFTSRFLEENNISVFEQWQKDCKMFSRNMLASRHEVVHKFLCVLNDAELRTFLGKTDSLKSKLDRLSKKYIQIQTNLHQIDKRVNENSNVFYRRHYSVFLNILYFTKPSWILYPKKINSCNDLDIVSFEDIAYSETADVRLFSNLEIPDNFLERCSLFDQKNSDYKAASSNHSSNYELNLLPQFSKTSIEKIKDVKCFETKTDISSINFSELDLIIELQNCQQLLSRIENTYNLVKKRLEASLFIKSMALTNKHDDSESESSQEDIHSKLDYKLTNNFAEDDISDFEKLDNIRSCYHDAFHTSNVETEIYYSPEYFLNTHANIDFKGNSLLVRAVPKIQFSKAICNGKSVTCKSIITKPGEKLAFRFLDPFPVFEDEVTKIQAILDRLEKTYDVIENEAFLWVQNTENSAENDFISCDKETDNDNNFYENNDKRDNCLMRFKAGNFYDWDLDDFESSESKLPTIIEEEKSESELDSSESSLDGSYKSWQCDSRASTSSEDSDSPEFKYEIQSNRSEFKTVKFSGNLNSEQEANLSVTSESCYNMASKSTNVNSDHFNFVSALLYSLQRLCNSDDIVGSKNQPVNDYILK